MSSVDVCIVGAGISGLACAHQLKKLNSKLSVVVLEARDRVGGRCCTVACGDGVVDVGGQWIGATQMRVAALVKELKLTMVAQQWLGTDATREATSGDRSTFVAEIPVRTGPADLSADETREIGSVIADIDQHAKTVPLDAPWTCPSAGTWDAMSVEDFFKSKKVSDIALRELRLGVQTILASEPRDLSFLYFLFFVHAAGGFRYLSDGPGGAQHYKVTTGMQSVCRALAAVLESKGVSIVLNASVRTIRNRALETAGGPAIVYVDRHDGGCSQYVARRVVVAVPPPVAAAIDVFPGSPQRLGLARAMHMGACIKTICVYKKAFWHISPEEKRTLDLHYSDLGPVSNMFDATIGNQPALVGLVVGDTARAWSSRVDSAHFRAAVVQQYAHIFASRKALQPVIFMAKSWIEEPLTRGCYAAVMGPGVMTQFGPAMFAPVGAVHWAGTEASTSWNGYFEGAVQAGQREAEAIILALDAVPPASKL